MEVFTLDQIEGGSLNHFLNAWTQEGYELVSRDQFTGELTPDKTELFENDIVQVSYNEDITPIPGFEGEVRWLGWHTCGFSIVKTSGGEPLHGTYSLKYSGSAVKDIVVVGQTWRREGLK